MVLLQHSKPTQEPAHKTKHRKHVQKPLPVQPGHETVHVLNNTLLKA